MDPELLSLVNGSSFFRGLRDHCWSTTSARFARIVRAGSSCVGSPCLEVTLVYTDKSQNHTCTQSPRLRAAKTDILFATLSAASRSLLRGLTSACVSVDNVVFTHVCLRIPLPHKQDCTCDVTIQPFSVTPTLMEKSSLQTAAAGAHVITAFINGVLL